MNQNEVFDGHKSTSGFSVILIIFVAVVILALGAGGYIAYKNRDSGGQTFCTQEAKQCPNGSYVGRTGPNCEFAPCPPIAPCEGEECPNDNDPDGQAEPERKILGIVSYLDRASARSGRCPKYPIDLF